MTSNAPPATNLSKLFASTSERSAMRARNSSDTGLITEDESCSARSVIRAYCAGEPSLAACPAAPGLAEEIEDLEAEASRMEQRRYDASDRKYQGARAMAARDLKAEYAQRVSRRPRAR